MLDGRPAVSIAVNTEAGKQRQRWFLDLAERVRVAAMQSADRRIHLTTLSPHKPHIVLRTRDPAVRTACQSALVGTKDTRGCVERLMRLLEIDHTAWDDGD